MWAIIGKNRIFPDGMQVSVWMILFLQISGNFYIVIPAQAGIYRHSRAGGNPEVLFLVSGDF
ncbi:hypothetical protein [Neisseria meningitidis]|uniref:hypothetical protein n=1 Tax=Neisseria meningitidis TaxID=487 RepID=UPI00067B0873|nr:hypothetical protein [Neisseria meningitidis]